MSAFVHEDPFLERFVRILEEEHGCHTVILYGSRARGTHTPTSDYDLLGIRTDGEDTRDARRIAGVFLDAFVRHETTVVTQPEAFLHVRGGVLLRDPRGIGARLLEEVTAILDKPPADVPRAEIEARRTWCIKMLERIRNAGPEDIEAHYRLHWLLVDLLEFYFVLRRRHYLGSKESFAWMSVHDARAYQAFAEALRPGAGVPAVERVVAEVLTINGAT
ncbi:MAG TPA: nucleotidyltransferase domain-containing protein [Polyangium sp.]|nr:nucleotidyltransferase domain-containing protein [Polyangium sp.]